MSQSRDDGPEVACGRVSLKTGTLQGSLQGTHEAKLAAALENLTAAAPELLHVSGELDFASLFESLGSRQQSGAFQELILISPARVYVVQRDGAQPELARVAVAEHTRKLGLLLSNLRARLARHEAQP